MLNDPDMREIVEGFCEETSELLEKLEAILEELEDEPNQPKLLEEFGQVIDRVMGAAKSIGVSQIATFCELGKIIGYKSSQIKDVNLIEIVVATLFDAVDLLRSMNDGILKGNSSDLKDISTDAFVTRLKWLSTKFKNIDRASVSYNDNLEQGSIDDLLSDLGL